MVPVMKHVGSFSKNKRKKAPSIAILSLTDVITLKQEVKNLFSAEVHFHDHCGGQYFTLEETGDELKKYIIQFFAEKNGTAVFSQDGLQFTIEENISC